MNRHNLPVCSKLANLHWILTVDSVNAPAAGSRHEGKLCRIDAESFPFLQPFVFSSRLILGPVLILATAGCGTTQMRSGTEQLLLSNAVDRSIDRIDLSALDGETVFLDATYIKPDKLHNSSGADNYVNASYIISALRQKLITSGCQLKTAADQAEYVVEARVGALGTDALEVTYGIPANNALTAAATLLTAVPAAPTVPEISIGKRNSSMSTAKLVLFAYHRKTGHPVWQSGAAVAQSDAKESWLFGAGPLQSGSIYGGTHFAGTRLRFPGMSRDKTEVEGLKISNSHQFVVPRILERRLAEQAAETDAAGVGQDNRAVVPATHEEPAD